MHTVSGKITRAPKIQPGSNNNGTYTAFFFEISEFNKGFGQEQDSYTNYSVALFPKSQGAIDFHMQAIAEGSFVVINAEKLKIDISNTDYPKLVMQNPRLEGFLNPNQGQQQSAPQQAPAYQQQAPQPAPQQQAPQMAPAYQPQQAPQQSQAANQFFDPNTQAPQPQNYNGG